MAQLSTINGRDKILKGEIDRSIPQAEYFVATVQDVVGSCDRSRNRCLGSVRIHGHCLRISRRSAERGWECSRCTVCKGFRGTLDLRRGASPYHRRSRCQGLDDAVHIKLLQERQLWAGCSWIADVSYVQEGSALDKEALTLTSVHVTDRVAPMLPERLSNGICSLSKCGTAWPSLPSWIDSRQGQAHHYPKCRPSEMTYSDVNIS